MLQQMLMEDKADMVREAVIKSLGIIMGYIDDPDKYQQVRLLWLFHTQPKTYFFMLVREWEVLVFILHLYAVCVPVLKKTDCKKKSSQSDVEYQK